jgi:phenylalanyl-tRNA synthetase alpha chain
MVWDYMSIANTHLSELITELLHRFQQDLKRVHTPDDLEKIRITYLSRHGHIAEYMGQLKQFSLEEKKIYGPQLNKLKDEIQELFNQKKESLEKQQLDKESELLASFDVTAYRTSQLRGSLHPYTHVTQIIENIFVSMGFAIVDGPEIENDYHNFEALNIPEHHPARDMQDTFWLTLPHMLMRTHTSSVEVHTMLNQKPPIAIAAPGRCYRNEATDASHDFMFMQVEGLFIDKNVSLANLFGTIKVFLQALFQKKDLNLRIRPSYFPFVEPGVEFDITCPFCCNGCSVCKKTGWIEMGGAGLTHPKVLAACGINPEQYSGFAFGLGLTRLTMLKYGINDIRLLHSNKVDFLKQF